MSANTTKTRTVQSRKTKQRAAVQNAVENASRPLSIAEVLEAASRSVEGIGIATVYRAIGDLVAEGTVAAVEIPGEPTRYELAGKSHHHHFQCEQCQKLFDIEGCIENLKKLLPPKFRLSDHAVTLYGLCAACGSRRTA
jgi:Fur family transcriptional regulator, ferric uptake regulator